MDVEGAAAILVEAAAAEGLVVAVDLGRREERPRRSVVVRDLASEFLGGVLVGVRDDVDERHALQPQHLFEIDIIAGVAVDFVHAKHVRCSVGVALEDAPVSPVVLGLGRDEEIDGVRRAVQDGVRALVRDLEVVREVRLGEGLPVETGVGLQAALLGVFGGHDDELSHGGEVLDVGLADFGVHEPVVRRDKLQRVLLGLRVLARRLQADNLLLGPVAELGDGAASGELATLRVAGTGGPVVSAILAPGHGGIAAILVALVAHPEEPVFLVGMEGEGRMLRRDGGLVRRVEGMEVGSAIHGVDDFLRVCDKEHHVLEMAVRDDTPDRVGELFGLYPRLPVVVGDGDGPDLAPLGSHDDALRLEGAGLAGLEVVEFGAGPLSVEAVGGLGELPAGRRRGGVYRVGALPLYRVVLLGATRPLARVARDQAPSGGPLEGVIRLVALASAVRLRERPLGDAFSRVV